MKRQKWRFLAAAVLPTLLLCMTPAPASCDAATNIILFIGDGMGFEQIRAGSYFTGTNLVFEAWPRQGEVRTYSANSNITDSAASGTAFATGHKVNNGVVSLAIPGDGSEYETVLEFFNRHGKRTGLVTTTTITHATLAVFGAHETSRNNTTGIAADYLQRSRPNLLFGGRAGVTVQQAAGAGYTVVTNRVEMQSLDTSSENMLMGLFGVGFMPYEYDGLGDLPHLSEMTHTALDILGHSTNGFFLMVEGGRIDHACHANNIARCVREVEEFDNAVQTAVAWVSNRTDTLIIVTADHETGGLEVLADNGPGSEPDVSWSSYNHTGANVGIFAVGPGSQPVSDIIDNTDVYRIMMRSQTITPEARAIDAHAEGDVELTWDAKPLDICRLERSDNLLSTNWTPILTVTASTHVVNLTDINTSGVSTGFYRMISSTP